MKEIWKDVYDLEDCRLLEIPQGTYEISNLGRGKSLSYNKSKRLPKLIYWDKRSKTWLGATTNEGVWKQIGRCKDMPEEKDKLYAKCLKIYQATKKTKIFKQGSKEPYRRFMLSGLKASRSIKIHRLVAQAFIPNPKNLPIVEHKDQNSHNNHVENLRWATVSQNQYNTSKSKNGSSKYKGCFFHKNENKFHVKAWISGKNTNLGYFTAETEAAKVWDQYMRDNIPKEDLDFINFNFPEDINIS
jgi:hypothetical protein